jgi:hypothetical protein
MPPFRASSLSPRSLLACGAFAVGAVVVVGMPELAAQRAARPMADPGSLWISDAPLDDTRRLLLVVDPATRHSAIYHVDAAAGTMTLRSTRDITWDLMVDDFNAQDPRPSALRRTLQTGPVPPAESIPPAR